MNARRRNADRRHWPANLYQNGNGSLWFRNPETGKTTGLGTDLQTAIRLVKRANLELARRSEERDLLKSTEAQGVTLAQHCIAYETEYAIGKKNTVIAMKSQLKAIRLDERANKTIASFTPKDAADLIKNAVEERGANMAASIRARLKDVFRDAILHGLCERNPVEAVLRPKVVVARARMDEETFWKIHEHAERWLKNAMMLALFTGQRVSDVRAMRFDDAKDGYLWVQQGKTGAKIKIPLSVGLKDRTIADLISECRDRAASRYLVHFSVDGFQTKRGAAVSQGAITRAFTSARQKAEIPTPEGATPTTFHEIRSLCARLYSEAYGAAFAQALLGHKSASMTELYKDVRGQQWVEVKQGTTNG